MASTTEAETIKSEQLKEEEKKTKSKPTIKGNSNGVDIKKLLEAGAHFGHKTSRWHPAMREYIHSKKDGTHIIDLTKTVEGLERALEFLTEVSSQGKQVLFVGTKRQAQDIVKSAAQTAGMPYVTERWLGGMLTNQQTIGGRIKYLKDLETKLESGQLAAKYNKLELQRFQEEIEAMNVLYGGIKDMAAKPGALYIVDILQEANAVKEANKLGIPIVAITDTNTDPRPIQYPVPANDDAIKTIQLITDYVRQAVETGKATYAKKAEKTADKPDKDELPQKPAAPVVIAEEKPAAQSSDKGIG